MASKLRKSERGAALIEFTAVMMVLFVFLLGTVDLCLLMVNWANYNRVAYVGARTAVITNPVATKINDPIAAKSGAGPGDTCLDVGSGGSSGYCNVKASSTCWATDGGTGGQCTNSYSFDNEAFKVILKAMNDSRIVGPLDRRQIKITYAPTNVGFVSRPNGSPMNVTVSLQCLQNELFFISYLLRWTLPTPASCSGFTPPKGLPLPAFATTLPSEDLTTN